MQSDEEDKGRRRQEFTAQVQEEFISIAMREEQDQAQRAEEQEKWRASNKVVYVRGLAEEVTKDLLGWIFEQIGH